MAPGVSAILLVAIIAVLSAVCAIAAPVGDAQALVYFHESYARNRDVGNVVKSGNNFQSFDAAELGPEGDGAMSKECMEYWIVDALLIQFRAGTSTNQTYCPIGPFGASLVTLDDDPANPKDSAGRNCGKKLAENSGLRESRVSNPAMHSELNAILRISDCNLYPQFCVNGKFPHAQNKTFWQGLYLVTSGASCVLDAAATNLAGIRNIIQGVSVHDVLVCNWGQPSYLEPEVIYASSREIVGPLKQFRNIARDKILRYFCWQFPTRDENGNIVPYKDPMTNTEMPHACPPGCVLNNGGQSFPPCITA